MYNVIDYRDIREEELTKARERKRTRWYKASDGTWWMVWDVLPNVATELTWLPNGNVLSRTTKPPRGR